MSVNISYRQRERLLNISRFWLGRSTSDAKDAKSGVILDFTRYAINGDIFDGTVKELLRLMLNSFYRFKATDDYEQLLEWRRKQQEHAARKHRSISVPFREGLQQFLAVP